ncbi:MAG: transcriptional regulator [Deltaproteobacteria bacterium]|nr:transcriptional regulator [Deltaproteobacteria bacterium]
MKVEILDLKQRYQEEKVGLLKCIKRVLQKGNLILTPEVERFEKAVSKFTGSKYCLGVNSGTDALMLSLWGAGVKRGDEVITSPISFIATSNSISHICATPVFVDIDDDLNINPDLIEKAITRRTKAIMPVHWTGRVCNMDKILRIAKKYNLLVVEDAAQAMGAYFKNKHAGTFGKISGFSAHPFKNLNAVGDAGFVITNEKRLYDKIKMYRNHGLKGRDNVEMVGINSRLDSLNAEILSFRLKRLNNIIARKKKNINYYKKYLKSGSIKIIPERKSEKSSHSMFVTLCEDRDKLQKYLEKFKIQTRVYYKTPLHLYKATKYLKYKKGDLPKAEEFSKKFLSLPYHQHLSRSQIRFVCKKINDFYG